jgi:hypothetical protein
MKSVADTILEEAQKRRKRESEYEKNRKNAGTSAFYDSGNSLNTYLGGSESGGSSGSSAGSSGSTGSGG